MGGLDRIATVVKRIRAERGEDKVLLLDGGDTWQGSYTAQKTMGADMVDCDERARARGDDLALGVHASASTASPRSSRACAFAFLGGNIYNNEWNEPAYEAYKIFEKGGVKIGVDRPGIALSPIANPGWMFPELSFGIREEDVARNVAAVREEGADVVVLLSHNGFDVDRKLASRVPGIDVILTGHTHDAIPEPVIVGKTLLIASGSHGKYRYTHRSRCYRTAN